MIDADTIPYLRFLGVSIETDDDGVLVRMRFGEHLVGNPRLPALHGGTLGALLESVAILQIMIDIGLADEARAPQGEEARAPQGGATELPRDLPKTINLTVDYLRSGRPEDTFARATIEKRGRRVFTVRAVAWQSDRDKPIAFANGHFLINADPKADMLPHDGRRSAG